MCFVRTRWTLIVFEFLDIGKNNNNENIGLRVRGRFCAEKVSKWQKKTKCLLIGNCEMSKESEKIDGWIKALKKNKQKKVDCTFLAAKSSFYNSNFLLGYFISNSSNKWSRNSSSPLPTPFGFVPGEERPIERGRAICRSESSTTAGKNIGLGIVAVVVVEFVVVVIRPAEAAVADEPFSMETGAAALPQLATISPERWNVAAVGGPFAVKRRQIRFRLAPLKVGIFYWKARSFGSPTTYGDLLLEF
jgi:hypothetical protein